MSDVEALSHAIMLQIQCRDFGAVNSEGDFVTTPNKIDGLSAACDSAAQAAISALQSLGWRKSPHDKAVKALRMVLDRVAHCCDCWAYADDEDHAFVESVLAASLAPGQEE